MAITTFYFLLCVLAFAILQAIIEWKKRQEVPKANPAAGLNDGQGSGVFGHL
jgi:hypothetical protein